MTCAHSVPRSTAFSISEPGSSTSIAATRRRRSSSGSSAILDASTIRFASPLQEQSSLAGRKAIIRIYTHNHAQTLEARMRINRLKYFRVMNAETQTQTAKVVGVTQPTYQRWETGKVQIPKGHLARLAKHFKTTELELLGRHPPKRAAFHDNEAPLDLQYYGECAVHFVDGGKPLLLSISEEAYAQAYAELQSNKRFIIVKNLGNRTVAIQHKAISEFYFSSEAYDTYGPDHEDYELATPIQMPDTRDWAIVEAIRDEEIAGGDYTSDFAKDDLERVR